MRSHFRFSTIAGIVATLLCATFVQAGGPQVDVFRAHLDEINEGLKVAQTELSKQEDRIEQAGDRLSQIQASYNKSGDKKAAQRALRSLASAVSFIADDHASTNAFIESLEEKLNAVADEAAKHGSKMVLQMVADSFDLLKETQDRAHMVGTSLDKLRTAIRVFGSVIA